MDDELQRLLRAACQHMDAAIDLVSEWDEEHVAAPGKGYLLGLLDAALAIVELQLPEHRAAILLELGDQLLPIPSSARE